MSSAAPRRRRILGARLSLLVAGLALTTGAQVAAGRAAAPLAQMAAPGAGDRILVIAPHPDDETLCCGGYLQQAVAAGASVGVVWMTAGDSFEFDAIVTERTLRPKGAGLEKLGVLRMAEAHAAADRLGVPRAQQYLLGFPDRDLRILLRESATVPLRSRYTGVSAVPYGEALHPGSAYTGAALRGNLQEVIERFAPTIVLASAPQDRHPDHSASGALAVELVRVLLRGPANTPLRSRYTGVSAVPYAEALHPGSAYTGAALRRNLQEVIERLAPTIVLAAAPQDRHPDHSASGALAVELVRAGATRAKVYYWIVHGGHEWPVPRGLHRERPQLPPRSARDLAWERLPLSDAQVAGKLAALGEHRTQLRVMRRFLYAFVRNDEIYAPVP
jgi:LmbE family N-acetylglucosaminyl deacetylase